MRRMPPTTQRRNTDYLNRLISRFGQLDRDWDEQALMPGSDLRLISGARSSGGSDQLTLALPTWTSRFARMRRLIDGQGPSRSSS
jgi:hypothetical protein